MSKKQVISTLLSLVIGLSSCVQREKEAITINVGSLKEHYTLLVRESNLWKGDSYLSSVKIDFEERGGKIFASFQSPSTANESLQLVFNPETNNITKEIFEHKVPILFHVPIFQSDWNLDSVDAMRSFLSYDDVQDLWLESPGHCNDLGLRHFFVNDQWKLAWILTVSDCQTYTEYFYVDPKSGERLELVY